MQHEPEVVITGAGVVSPIGIGMEAFWESLRTGRSGVGVLQHYDGPLRASAIGAEVADWDGTTFVQPRKRLKLMSRELQMAFGAGVLAFRHAGVGVGQIDPDRLGVVLGSQGFYTDIDDLLPAMRACLRDGQFDAARWAEHALRAINPLWLLKYLPNMAACHLAIAFDARAHNNTIALSETSSLLAVMEAAQVIRRGGADVMLAGGLGTRVQPTAIPYRGEATLSHRIDDPRGASRPFDATRDGMINGEGSGVFVLESRVHAEARGAVVLARVVSASSSFEPQSPGQPNTGRAIRHTITAVMAQSRITPEQLSHVNAHGVSTIEDDITEALAIRDTLGDVPVTAPKSFFGNLGAGTGAVEMAASLQALQSGLIPFTLNYQTPDPNCPLHVVRDACGESDKPYALLLNQAWTGQATALLIASDAADR